MNQPTGFSLPSLDIGLTDQTLTSKHKLRVSLVLSLLAGDYAALFSGIAIAHIYQFGSFWNGEFLVQMATIVIIYTLSAVAVRACVGDALMGVAESLRRGFLAMGTAAAILVFLLFTLKETDNISRTATLSGFCLSTIFILLIRAIHVRYARNQLGGELYSVVLLQDGQFLTSFGKSRPINIARNFDPAKPSAEDYHRLAGILSSADRVIVRCEQERRDVWAHVLQGMNVHAEIVAPEISQTGALAIGNFHGRPTYVVARGPLSLRDRLVKRSFDMLIASLAVVFLSPFFILIAFLIKADSPGPIFFRQQRIGRQNRLFNIYKFRSMKVEGCDVGGVQSASRQDSRVTRVGRTIRSTSLDELPQLFNVLKGDMSIVGPRPHAIHSTADSKLFWEVDHRYWYRHACKPGITGLAQIRGFRGATLEERDLRDRLEADLEYLTCWSLWNDISIIVRTVAVLMHRNAY